MFDTKIAIVVREDLATWQKLNVTAFLTSGVVGRDAGLLGESYEDAAGNIYNALVIQPIIVLSADTESIQNDLPSRNGAQRPPVAPYRGYVLDWTRRREPAAVKQYEPSAMKIVGLALREEKKLVDKITRGARMHG